MQLVICHLLVHAKLSEYSCVIYLGWAFNLFNSLAFVLTRMEYYVQIIIGMGKVMPRTVKSL